MATVLVRRFKIERLADANLICCKYRALAVMLHVDVTSLLKYRGPEIDGDKPFRGMKLILGSTRPQTSIAAFYCD